MGKPTEGPNGRERSVGVPLLKGDQQRQRSPRRTSNRTAGSVRPQGSGETADSSLARGRTEGPMFGENLMEEICERSNLEAALRRVRANRGDRE